MNLKRILVCIVIIKQLMWIAFIPLWQFPDEQAHFAQVQNYAERKNLKYFPPPTTSREIYETEILLGTLRDELGNNKYTYHPEFNIDYSQTKIGPREKEIDNFPKSYRSEYSITEATLYPPLYYILGVPFYYLGYESSLIVRVFLARLFNLLLSISLIYVIYLIGKELFNKNTVAVFTFTILTLFHPMFSFVSAGFNSDNLYNLLFTIGIFLGIRSIKKGVSGWLTLLIVLTVILGEWIKPQARLLILIYIPVFIRWLLPVDKKKTLFTIAVVTVFIYLMRGTISHLMTGEQFLPDIPGSWRTAQSSLTFFDHLKFTLIHTYREIMPWYWGIFRWLSFTYPRVVHRIINYASLISIIGLGWYMVRVLLRKPVIVAPRLVVYLLYSTLIYFLALTVYDFLFTRGHGFSLGIQGRYFFPLISAHMALIVVGSVTLLDSFRRLKLLLLLGVSMIVLHSYALFWLIQSYYAKSSNISFFITASQYKPQFFKSPYLEVIVLSYIICILIFLHKYLTLKHVES